MPRRLNEQSVVVVGASSGIGRATALAFAKAGAVVTCAARGEEALETLVAKIEAAGGRAMAVPTDITEEAAVRRLAKAAEERFGRIDTWVNAAAVAVWGRIEEITSEEFDRVMRVNFLGHVHGVQAVLPAMRRAGGGVIIGIASIEAIRAVPLHAPYTASKWALRAFYDCLRMELAADGVPIAVTTVLPSSIDTPIFEHGRSKMASMPKPPPPVYAPEVVAAAIVRAAVRPTREVPVGGTAFAAYFGQRISPALSDAIMSIPWVQKAALTADRPDDGKDNLDAPLPEAGQVHGSFPGHVLQRSAFTSLLGHMRKPGEIIGAIARATRARSNH